MSSTPPPIRNTTAAHHIAGTVGVETQVDYLIMKVARLSMTNKILTWGVCTAVAAGLAGVGTVASGIYSRGVKDETMRAGIERAQMELIEVRSDVRELQRFMFARRSTPVLPMIPEDK